MTLSDSRRPKAWATTLLAALLAASAAAPASAETWTDITGKFSVTAEFVSVTGGAVVLKKPDGRVIAVKLSQLNPASRQLAEKLAAAKPAPAPVDSDDPVAYFEALVQRVEAGDGTAMWNAIPSAYQQDLNQVLHEFAQKMDSELWDSSMGLVRKVGAILEQKSSFIVASVKKTPVGAAMAQVDDATVKQVVGDIGAILTALTNSDIANLQKLKSADLGQLLAATNNQLTAPADRLKATLQKQGGFPGVPLATAQAKIELVSRASSDLVTLKFTPPPGAKKTEPQVLEFVRIEGKWFPKAAADVWSAEIGKARQWIAGPMAGNLQQAKAVVTIASQMASPMLDQLLKADTQQKFDAVVQQAMQIGMKMAGGANNGGGAPGPAPNPF